MRYVKKRYLILTALLLTLIAVLTGCAGITYKSNDTGKRDLASDPFANGESIEWKESGSREEEERRARQKLPPRYRYGDL